MAEILTDLLPDFVVPLQAFRIPESGRVDDRQRVIHSRSFGVKQVVSGDDTRLTFGLRHFGLLDQLKPEIVFPFDTQDVVDHRVD